MRDKIINRILELAAETSGIDKSEIKVDENLMENSGFDSLDFIELIMKIEKEYKFAIPDEKAENLVTILAMADYTSNYFATSREPGIVFVSAPEAVPVEIFKSSVGTILTDVDDWLIGQLIKTARQSKCVRSKCGSIIVDINKSIIGRGYNSLPTDGACETCMKDEILFSPKFKSDKSCCVHAEQRAIMDMLRRGTQADKISNGTLFFLRLDDRGNPQHSGQPWCTVCSKLALDVGIANFVLFHKEGWTSYDTKTYNDLSFKY